MPSKAKAAPSHDEQVGKSFADLNKPDLEVIVSEEGGHAPGTEKTVVYKDTNGDWDYCHLNADGEAWVHSPEHEEKWSKNEAIAAAGLAFPAWPVETVDDNPWAVEVSPESESA